MLPEPVYVGLAEKTMTAEELAKQAATDTDLVLGLVTGMGEAKAEVKYGCAKALRLLVDEEPELLYPYFDTFADLLDNQNKIFVWEALYVLAGLASVDEENKLDGVLKDYFANIEGPIMVTAANTIKGAAQIVRARPRFAGRVAREVLRAEQGRYETAECYEIVIGTAIKAFYKIHKWVPEPRELDAFVARHTGSNRPATRNAASKYLSKYRGTLSLA